jgi:ribosomal protein S18 acetylase RimI-like enzyme
MDVRIRKARLSDSLSIAKMHRASYLEAHSTLLPGKWIIDSSEEGFQQRWKKRLSKKQFNTYVAELNQQIVGVVCFSKLPNIEISEILYLYVDPHFLRHGIGRELMLFVLTFLSKKDIKMVHLWALKNNPKSRAFYESLGAQTDGTERVIDNPTPSTHEVEYYIFLSDFSKLEKRKGV